MKVTQIVTCLLLAVCAVSGPLRMRGRYPAWAGYWQLLVIGRRMGRRMGDVSLKLRTDLYLNARL